jgi:hypothetical protein
MMAYLTRRENFADGSPPPKKPYSAVQFKNKADVLLQGVYGTGKSSNAFLVDLMQKELDKAVEEGVVTMQEGLEFIKSRKKYYDDYLKEQSKTTDGPIGLPQIEEREEFNKGTSKDFNRNPGGKNQYTPQTLNQVLAILKDPQYSDYRKSDFYKKGIIGRKTLNKYERENPGLIKYPAYGKRSDPKKTRGEQNLKASQFYKSTQGGAISMDKINNFAHYAPKLLSYLTSTSDTGPLKATVNRAAEGYDKEALKIAKKQEKLLKEKPKNYKDLLIKENYKAANLSKKANKELPNKLRGTLGYFVVNPDNGKFTLKGVDRAKTFAGISGEKREYIKMNPSDRVAFGPTQSKVQNVIDFVKSKVKGADVKRASNAPIPNKVLTSQMFKGAFKGMPGGSGDRPLKDPLGGQIDLIDVKELIKKPYDNT